MPSLTISENEARKIRYKILMQHALQKGCDAIILGHNSDDYTETLISNFLRGTSLNGIANFTIKKKLGSQLSILRPLIHFSKAEIGWLCRLFCMPVWSDETNYNVSLKRSRIRYELLPYIQNFFNPRIRQALQHFSQLCDLENEYIKENTVKLYTKSIHRKLLGINLRYLKKQHKVLRRRVLRLYFYYHFNIQLSSEITELILLQRKSGLLNIPNLSQVCIYKVSTWMYISIKEA
jgi:tRNA(Ile)-lysidine synthase